MEPKIRTPLGIFNRSKARDVMQENGIAYTDETWQPLTIRPEIWEPNPDKPGYLHRTGMMTRGEVLAKLNEYLRAYRLKPDEYGFDLAASPRGIRPKDEPFPEYRSIVCFAVTGGSEGYYVHIEAVLDSKANTEHTGTRTLVYLAKCWDKNLAWKLARACAEIFET